MSRGFTLIELLLVMIILAILAGLVAGNVISSLKKGRDVRRKADLVLIQRAIELYYEDNKAFPSDFSLVKGLPICHPDGCSTKNYLQKTPLDPSLDKGYHYVYCIDDTQQSYQLYAELENTQDKAIITPAYLANCSSSSCFNNECNYGVSSGNATP